MREFIEELEHNQKINMEKGLENRVDIDYVIERLEDIEKETDVSPYWSVSKIEVETVIDDIHNDELYCYDEELMKKLDNIDVNHITTKVYDDDCWRDVYDSARYYVLKEIESEED